MTVEVEAPRLPASVQDGPVVAKDHVSLPPAGRLPAASSYLQYLPAPYQVSPATLVPMPRLGQATTARVARWLKQPGDRVERDEPLAELAVNGSVIMLPSPVGGVLRKLLVPLGAGVPAGRAIAAVDDDAPFLTRFLLIFESILGPIEQTIDNLARYFDPLLAPPELLPWLASWVGIELDDRWPLDRQRQLVRWAVRLFRRRGTRRGLREHLRLYTGRTPLIVENFDGMRVGQDALLGVSTQVGRDTPRANWLHVTVFADLREDLDERVVRHIVEFHKPAHVAYTLEIRAPEGDAV